MKVNFKLLSKVFIIFLALIGCEQGKEQEIELKEVSTEKTKAELKLEARNAEFVHEVIEVAENVYVASGFDVASVSMIVGDDGYILIDTGMLPRLVQPIKDEFQKITSKPLKAIIYTHGHGDHTGGTQVFTEGQKIPIWTRDNHGSEDYFNKRVGLNPRFRGMRQAGFSLPAELRINNGIAPAVYPKAPLSTGNDKKAEKGHISNEPTDTFKGDKKVLEISGITLELYKAPGETDDQLYVWLPDEKVLFTGDNFYKSWPNLYAIRGTEYRDVYEWILSLESMLKKEAEVLVGGHTRPIVGKEEANEVLTNYHYAVKFVFEKTIEGMNKGLTPDELVEYVQLPEKYKDLDYLHGYYGRIDWSVRQIFNGYLGWFDGNATSLIPLSPKVEAQKMIDLAGGQEKVVNQIKLALNSQDFQWAAQLCDYLLQVFPDEKQYKELKANAMTGLGRNVDNALARNYYLTTAQELRSEK